MSQIEIGVTSPNQGVKAGQTNFAEVIHDALIIHVQHALVCLSKRLQYSICLRFRDVVDIPWCETRSYVEILATCLMARHH